jgi:hypothetical protein
MRDHLPVCDKKIKRIVSPIQAMKKKYIAGTEVRLHIFFTSAPVILTPGKNPTTH